MAHFGKLREDERLFALLLDRCEKVQEHLHLAGFELTGFRNVGQDFTGWGFALLRMTLGRGVRAFCWDCCGVLC